MPCIESLSNDVKESCISDGFVEASDVLHDISTLISRWNNVDLMDKTTEFTKNDVKTVAMAQDVFDGRWRLKLDDAIILSRIISCFYRYQEQPHLLDPWLSKICEPIMKFMTCHLEKTDQACAFLRVFYVMASVRGSKALLRFFPHEVGDLMPVLKFAENITLDTDRWEARYMVLLWLSLISMIPFDLATLDSTALDRLMKIAKFYMDYTSKEGEAASLLLARLCCRKDVDIQSHLEWCLKQLVDSSPHKTKNLLYTLQLIAKHGQTTSLIQMTPFLLTQLEKLQSQKSMSDTLSRKLLIKCNGRLGLVLVDDMPPEMDGIMDKLLQGLSDKDTIVRWAAAKALARISARLDQEMRLEVQEAIMELFSRDAIQGEELDLSSSSEHSWHGACLAIAELGRRGLLSNLSSIIPCTLSALEFDVKRGNFSVGANVRDAACFVLWALVKTRLIDEMQQFATSVATRLVVTSILDREINVRRAASAAFQEGVGRGGFYPHGIDVLQMADYFSIGNRNNSYLDVALNVGKFEVYRDSLVHHLMQRLSHWDSSIRELAAESLGLFVEKYSISDDRVKKIMEMCKSNGIAPRHGAMLALGKICKACVDNGSLNGDLVKEIGVIPAQLSSSCLQKGGSDLLRQGVCIMISHLAPAYKSLGFEIEEAWWPLITSSLHRKEEICQEASVLAFSACSDLKVPEEILSTMVKDLNAHSDVVIRRGCALALGSLQRPYPMMDKIYQALLEASKMVKGPKYDAGTKRNSVLSLGNHVCLVQDHWTEAVETFLQGLEDYSSDHRGDVGSWVRDASMQSLVKILTIHPMVQVEDKVYPALLRQASEKIDKIRTRAGESIQALLKRSKEGREIVCLENDLAILYNGQSIDWHNAKSVFPRIVPLLECPALADELLKGIIVSAGGLTESLARHSSDALLDHLANLETIDNFSHLLKKIWKDNVRNSRIISSVLTVVEMLLVSGLEFLENDYHEFVDLTILSIKTKDVKRILAGVKLLSALVPFSKEALKPLVLQLSSEYPVVCKRTAEELYMLLPSLGRQDLQGLLQDWEKDSTVGEKIQKTLFQ